MYEIFFLYLFTRSSLETCFYAIFICCVQYCCFCYCYQQSTYIFLLKNVFQLLCYIPLLSCRCQAFACGRATNWFAFITASFNFNFLLCSTGRRSAYYALPSRNTIATRCSYVLFSIRIALSLSFSIVSL